MHSVIKISQVFQFSPMTKFEVDFNTTFRSLPAEMMKNDSAIDEMVHFLATEDGFLEEDEKSSEYFMGSVGSLIDFDEIFDDEELDNSSSIHDNYVLPMASHALESASELTPPGNNKYSAPQHTFRSVPAPVMNYMYPQGNSSVDVPAPVPSNMYSYQQNPPAPAFIASKLYPSQENSATPVLSNFDPNTFSRRFESLKNKLWNSMQKSEISRAHIDHMLAHKKTKRGQSTTAIDLATSRKWLQASFAGEFNYHKLFNVRERGQRKSNIQHPQNMISSLHPPHENNIDVISSMIG